MITAATLVDQDGLRSSTGRCITWADLEQDPAQGSIRFRPIFDRPFREFRRLDILSRMLIVAVEACDLETHLPDSARIDTALVFGTELGCLAADRRFERSLHVPSGIEPAVFPYTLPSTCLGEVAIRHRLHGPTICLSLAAGEESQVLRTATRLLEGGEARAAVVLVGDWVPGDKTRAAALLLRPGDPDTRPAEVFANPRNLAPELFEALAERLPH